MLKRIPMLCVLCFFVLLATEAPAQLNLKKLKKQKNELVKKKGDLKKGTGKKTTATPAKTQSSKKKTPPPAFEAEANEAYAGPAKQDYQTLVNRLGIVAKYVTKYQEATSDHQRGDARKSAESYLSKVEADLSKVAELDPALDLKEEQKAFDGYTVHLAKAIKQSEKEQKKIATSNQDFTSANSLLESILGLLKYGSSQSSNALLVEGLSNFTYPALEKMSKNVLATGGGAFIFRRNMDELRSLLPSADLSSWLTSIRNDVNNYQTAKQYGEAEEILNWFEPTVNFLAEASPNFTKLKADADFIIQSYQKKNKERAASLSTGPFHLEHLNEVHFSSTPIRAGQEKASQFKQTFTNLEPVRAIVYLDRPLKDLIGSSGAVPIDLFINDPKMQNGCVLQPDLSWVAKLKEEEQSYIILDIIPDMNDFKPRRGATGPEAFAKCFSGLSPGAHEVMVEVGLKTGPGLGEKLKASFTLTLDVASLEAFANLQTELEAARAWTQKNDPKPMMDAKTEKGLMKSLEAQIAGVTATKAIIRDRDWKYIRDNRTADTLGKQVAAEVFYKKANGQCYAQRVYGYYESIGQNKYVENVKAIFVNPSYSVGCK